VPVLKPTEPHSASDGTAAVPPPPPPGSGTAPKRGLRAAAAAGRAVALQLAAFAIAFGLVAAGRRLPVPGSGILPALAPDERAVLALTVLPHAVLVVLILALAGRRTRQLGLAAPAPHRGAVLLVLAWPLAQVAWTAALLALTGQAPARAWRLSPLLSGAIFWVWVLWLVVLAPVAEEMLFRGDLFGRLSRVLSPPATILLAAGLFALCHAQTGLTQPLSVVPLGLVLGLVRVWTGSLWPCIALHGASNGAVIAAMVWTTG
jgi:membrane protease YdiL (CAAX protease family)